MIGGRLLLFSLDALGLITWAPPLGTSIMSWIIPVGMPLVMITVMLLFGRGASHKQMMNGSEDAPLSEILQNKLALGEITEHQYEAIMRVLSDEKETN